MIKKEIILKYQIQNNEQELVYINGSKTQKKMSPFMARISQRQNDLLVIGKALKKIALPHKKNYCDREKDEEKRKEFMT